MKRSHSLEEIEARIEETRQLGEDFRKMKARLEAGEVTPDEWSRWHADYRARLDEAKEGLSWARKELSLREEDLKRQKQERAAELGMTTEEYGAHLKSLKIRWLY